MKTRGLFLLVNLLALIAFFWPFATSSIPQYFFEGNLFEGNLFERSGFALLIAFIAIAIIASEISQRLLDSKTVAVIGVISALIAALRLLGAGAIGIEPIWFLLILASRAFGARIGFSLGVISLGVSALITGGIGPWLAFQMLAAAWIGAAIVVIPRSLRGRKEVIALAVYGLFASLLFGVLMDLQLWPWLVGTDTQLSFAKENSILENFYRFLTFHFATALAWDIPRALVTATLIMVSAQPILASLRRAKVRLHFNEPAKAQAVLS